MAIPEYELRRQATVQAWERLQKKYTLPKLADLETKFRFTLYEPWYVLQVASGNIYTHLGNLAGTLEVILNPQQLSKLMEAKFLSVSDREEITKVFKRLMALIREQQASSFDDEAKLAKALVKIASVYDKEIAPFMKKHYNLLAKGWEKQEIEKIEKEYLG